MKYSNKVININEKFLDTVMMLGWDSYWNSLEFVYDDMNEWSWMNGEFDGALRGELSSALVSNTMHCKHSLWRRYKSKDITYCYKLLLLLLLKWLI